MLVTATVLRCIYVTTNWFERISREKDLVFFSWSSFLRLLRLVKLRELVFVTTVFSNLAIFHFIFTIPVESTDHNESSNK